MLYKNVRLMLLSPFLKDNRFPNAQIQTLMYIFFQKWTFQNFLVKWTSEILNFIVLGNIHY